MKKFSAPPNLDDPGGCSRSPSPLPGTAAGSSLSSCGGRCGDDCGCPRCSHKRTYAPVCQTDVPNIVIHQLAPVEKSCETKTDTPTTETPATPALPKACFSLDGVTAAESGIFWVAEQTDAVKKEWCLRPWHPQVAGTNPIDNPACGLVHMDGGVPRVITFEDAKLDINGYQVPSYDYVYALDGCNSHVVEPVEGQGLTGCSGKWELRTLANRMLRTQKLIRDVSIIDTTTTDPVTSSSYDLKSLFATGITGDADICKLFEQGCVVGAWVEACVQTAGNQKLEFRVGSSSDYMNICVSSSNEGYTWFKLDEDQPDPPETPEFLGRGVYNFSQVTNIWKVNSIIYLDNKHVDYNITSTSLANLVTALNNSSVNPAGWTWVDNGGVLQLNAPVSNYINYLLIEDDAYVIDEAPEAPDPPDPVGEDVTFAPACACSTEYVGLEGGRNLKWELLNPGDASLTEDDQVKIVLRLKALDLKPCCNI